MRVTCQEGCGCKRHSWKKPPGWNEKISLAKRAAQAKYLEEVKADLERRILRRVKKMKRERASQEEGA